MASRKKAAAKPKQKQKRGAGGAIRSFQCSDERWEALRALAAEKNATIGYELTEAIDAHLKRAARRRRGAKS